MAIGAFACLFSSAPAGASRLLVKFRPGVPPGGAGQALAAVGARQLRAIPDIGVRVVSVPFKQARRALASLTHDRKVRFAERDGLARPQEALPGDPYFPEQYALNGGAWGWYQTHTTQAWDITTGDPSVVVAILDTGLRTEGLSDFEAQVVGGWDVLTASSDTSSQAGKHGTYVAGVVGLAAGNGVGNAGFCPGCKIMPVQVGTDSGAYDSDIASGLTWAADHGARVANMSWASPETSSTLQSAIAYAHSKGLVMTAAAGNSNCDCATYPAAYPYVLGVAGTSNSGGKAGDSNYGNWVALAAPEGDMTAWPSINGAPGYAPVGGTSTAAPAAAGIAALLLSYNPALTNTQVEQALEGSAAPVPFTVRYGRADALAALQYLGAADPQQASAPVQSSPAKIYYEPNGSLTAIAPLSAAPQPGQVLVRGIGGWRGSAGLTVSGLEWQRCDGSGANCTGVTNATTYTVQSSDAGYTLKLVFSVRNGLGSTSAAALTLPVEGATATTTTTGSETTTTGSTTTTEGTSTTSGATQTLSFSGSLSSKHPGASFGVSVGAGLAEARLSFSSKCPSLNLALDSSAGAVLASASGPSVLVLDQMLSAGSYSYVVGGSTRCSFTLIVSSPAP